MTDFAQYHKIEGANKHQLPGGPLVLQHKLDGAQAGIELTDAGLLVHSRKTPLALISPTGTQILGGGNAGFAGLVALVATCAEDLTTFMTEHNLAHIYGEWLVPHTIKYADTMWRKFYVYDVLTREGVFCDPAVMMPDPQRFGFQPVERLEISCEGPLTHAALRAHTERLQAMIDYTIEGGVLKDYVADAAGITDRFGRRFVYKDVFPEFHEEKGSGTAAHAQLPVEQALASALPERTIQKRYLDVVAANDGRFESKLIPQILGRVWSDFLTEVLAGALRDLKHPVVNTNELKRLIDARARTFALNYTEEAA